MKQERLLLLACAMALLGSATASANGAAWRYGITGSNIMIHEGKPLDGLTVDEFVNIDLEQKRVDVRYFVTNASGKPINLAMAFPVTTIRGGDECLDFKESASYFDADGVSADSKQTIEEFFDFSAGLNRQRLAADYHPVSDVVLPTSYGGLEKRACAFYTFVANLKPGQNEIAISHRIARYYDGADGRGDLWQFAYPIWPAKNWVKTFRIAKWRVILPRTLSERLAWVGKKNFNTVGSAHLTFDVSAPGERYVHGNEYLFTAARFRPEGEVTVQEERLDVAKLVPGCTEQNLEKCWRGAFASYMEVKAYTGADHCYSQEDLGAVRMEDSDLGAEFTEIQAALPYLRNEIFARHGYRFNNEEFRGFFGAFGWYFPLTDSVELTAIEKFNVKFIQESEEGMTRGEHGEKFHHYSQALEEERKKLCPHWGRFPEAPRNQL